MMPRWQTIPLGKTTFSGCSRMAGNAAAARQVKLDQDYFKGYTHMITIPQHWKHMGLILARGGEAGGVVGDPCIVWDEDLNGWRMFLFVEKPGVGEAICLDKNNIGPGQWQYLGGLKFTNPEQILGGYTHKPYVVRDAYEPNRAALIDGRYILVSVSHLR